MIIGPRKAKSFIEHVKEEQIQQCGIDLKVKEIYKLEGEG